MGRPRKPIDWDQVDKLCAIQCTEEEIASVLGCSVDTICRSCKRKHGMTFADYFERKRKGGVASLRRRQWKEAVDEGNVAMLIWLGKQYLGQSEKVVNEHHGTMKMYGVDAPEDAV